MPKITKLPAYDGSFSGNELFPFVQDGTTSNAALSSIGNYINQTAQGSEIINIMQRGAAGDGVTDDTALVQSLIDDATPGSVILFPKTHLIEGLVLNKSLTLLCDNNEGQIIYNAAGTKAFWLSGSSDLDLKFMGLDVVYTGPWSNSLNEAIVGVGGTGGKVTIWNCKFTDVASAIFPFTVILDYLDVQQCEINYTYGRASVGNGNVAYDHPCVGILGGGITTIVRNNKFNGLVDPSFANVDPGAPLELRTPADGLYKTAGYSPEVLLIENNLCLNYGIEGIIAERYIQGRCDCRVASNVLKGSQVKSAFFATTMPGILVSNIEGASVVNNKISNSLQGIAVANATNRDDLDIVIANNQIYNVLGGISCANTSVNTIIEGNHIHLSSTFAKFISGGAEDTISYAHFVGIYANRGEVRNNTITADEPLWTSDHELISRSSYVFTLDSATGIEPGGLLMSFVDDKVAFLPVSAVFGNDVHIFPEWSGQVPYVTSGTLYYQAIPDGSFFTAAGISNVSGVSGDIIKAHNNTIQGTIYDFSIQNTGQIIEWDNTIENIKQDYPAISNVIRVGPKYKNRDWSIRSYGLQRNDDPLIIDVDFSTLAVAYSINSGYAVMTPVGLDMGTFTTAGGEVVVNFSNGTVFRPVLKRLDGNTTTEFNWGKRVQVKIALAIIDQGSSPTADNQASLLFGISPFRTSVGGLDAKGIGILIENLDISLTTHDGVSAYTTPLGTVTASAMNEILLDYDGTGNLSGYLNDNAVVTLTGGPTGNGSSFIHSGLASAWNTVGGTSIPHYYYPFIKIATYS